VWYYNIKIRKGKVNKMKKQTMIRQYRRFSGADGYVVGFRYKKNVYIIVVDKLMPRWLIESYESGSHEPKLQMSLKAKHKKQLIDKGAEFLMTEEAFEKELARWNAERKANGQKTVNRGHLLERLVNEQMGTVAYRVDTEKFSKCGDVRTADGRELQVKFENAQIVAVKALHNLQKQAREEKKLAKMVK
jgi:hypothetical protein